MEHSHSTTTTSNMNLITSLFFLSIGTFLRVLKFESELVADFFLQIPESASYELLIPFIKDILTVLCFIMAFFASYYTVKEKKESIRRMKGEK